MKVIHSARNHFEFISLKLIVNICHDKYYIHFSTIGKIILMMMMMICSCNNFSAPNKYLFDFVPPTTHRHTMFTLWLTESEIFYWKTKNNISILLIKWIKLEWNKRTFEITWTFVHTNTKVDKEKKKLNFWKLNRIIHRETIHM